MASIDWLNPPNTIKAVLCYVKHDNEFLLLLKSKGKFGQGFWNAPGGKIEKGESPEDAARREVFEETGLKISEVEHAGFLDFYFGMLKPAPDWQVEVFRSSSSEGTLTQSAEGELKWHKQEQLPYDQMWQDDRYWLPFLVQGKLFHGAFYFTADSKKLLNYILTCLG